MGILESHFPAARGRGRQHLNPIAIPVRYAGRGGRGIPLGQGWLFRGNLWVCSKVGHVMADCRDLERNLRGHPYHHALHVSQEWHGV